MQYFKPEGEYFAGDCMPFYNDGVFHLFYLLDQNHHQANNGLGGHQWAHLSTRDLKEWTSHSIAIKPEESWEASICTGSLIFYNGLYHAFYAVRKPDRTQHICHAYSEDCISFQKSKFNPILSAPAISYKEDFRDPLVFRDLSGQFNMIITSNLKEPPLNRRGGCLLRYTSSDLIKWKERGIFLLLGKKQQYASIPECPDIFQIGDYFYLLFGQGLETHYRVSQNPLGPWHEPDNDVIASNLCAVMKTAPFVNNRRIGVCWVGTREENKDSGFLQWGGNIVFREIKQNPDGTLNTSFLQELTPEGNVIFPTINIHSPESIEKSGELSFNAANTTQAVSFSKLPFNFKMLCEVEINGCKSFTFGIRGIGNLEKSYELTFDLGRRQISLHGQVIYISDDLKKNFTVEIVVNDSLIDVCINKKYTIINRLYELNGDSVFIFCYNGKLSVRNIQFYAI